MTDHNMSGHGRHSHDKVEHLHPAEGFEHRDLGAKTILYFLAGVTIFLTVAVFVVIGVYSFLNRYQRAHEPAPNPLVQTSSADMRVPTPGDAEKFPQPRLEEVERQNLDDARIKEEDILNSYGWMDEKAGVVHIPIERAMQLLEQRGLPTRPQSGTAGPPKAKTPSAKKKDTNPKTGR